MPGLKRSSPRPGFVCYKPNPEAAIRLFCFPYAGGGPVTFRAWADRLPPGVEVCPIELPGRGSRLREAPFSSMPALVEVVTQSLLSKLDKPFAFFGHSMGAIIAFELARQLRRECDLQPLHLFVSGHRAPHILHSYSSVHDLSDADFLKELRRLRGTPPEVLNSPELMGLMLPMLRADFAVVRTYAYSAEPRLECSISAYGGLSDYEFSHEHLEAWREQTTASFSLQMFPGDHFFINSSEPLLLRVLSQELQEILKTRQRTP